MVAPGAPRAAWGTPAPPAPPGFLWRGRGGALALFREWLAGHTDGPAGEKVVACHLGGRGTGAPWDPGKEAGTHVSLMQRRPEGSGPWPIPETGEDGGGELELRDGRAGG